MSYAVWVLSTVALLGVVALIYLQQQNTKKRWREEDDALKEALRSGFHKHSAAIAGTRINPDPIRAKPSAPARPPLPPASILRRGCD